MRRKITLDDGVINRRMATPPPMELEMAPEKKEAATQATPVTSEAAAQASPLLVDTDAGHTTHEDMEGEPGMHSREWRDSHCEAWAVHFHRYIIETAVEVINSVRERRCKLKDINPVNIANIIMKRTALYDFLPED